MKRKSGVNVIYWDKHRNFKRWQEMIILKKTKITKRRNSYSISYQSK